MFGFSCLLMGVQGLELRVGARVALNTARFFCYFWLYSMGSCGFRVAPNTQSAQTEETPPALVTIVRSQEDCLCILTFQCCTFWGSFPYCYCCCHYCYCCYYYYYYYFCYYCYCYCHKQHHKTHTQNERQIGSRPSALDP